MKLRNVILSLPIYAFLFTISTIGYPPTKVQGQSTFIGSTSRTSSYDINYQNLLNAAIGQGINLPSMAVQVAQNTLMAGLNSDGILAKTDMFKVFLGDGPFNFTDINWVNPSTYRSTHVSNPVYTINGGVQSDGVAGYIDTGFAPNKGVLYTLNACETIIYYKNLTGYSTVAYDGTRLNGTPWYQDLVNPRQSSAASGTIEAAANEAGLNAITGIDLTDGLYYYGRTNSSTGFFRKGSAARVTWSTSPNGLSNYDCLIGAMAQGAAPGSGFFNNDVVYMYWKGGVLTTTDEANFKTRWDTYQTTIAGLSAPATLGTKYNVSSWSNLNDFTNNGSTSSVVSNAISFSGGANTFTQSLDLTSIGGSSIGATGLSKFTLTALYSVGQKDASSQGGGIGLRSSQVTAAKQDLVCQFNSLSSGNGGKLILYNGSSHSQAAITSALTFSVNDVISISLTLTDGVASIDGYNVTTSSAHVTASANLYGAAGGQIHNTGHFALFSMGGAFSITSLTLSSTELYQPKIAILGDSKTQGYYATGVSLPNTILNAYAYKLQDFYGKSIVPLGCGGDATAEYLTRLTEITGWIKPNTVIIAGIYNDIQTGVASGTWQANLASIISTLQAAGINVLISDGIYATTADQTPVRTWVLANYPSSMILDYVNSVVALNADGIHPNTIGHATYTYLLLSSGKLPPIQAEVLPVQQPEEEVGNYVFFYMVVLCVSMLLWMMFEKRKLQPVYNPDHF